MMKIYSVRVGRYTERNDFEELLSRIVSVSYTHDFDDVNYYFKEKYEGFSVIVATINELTVEELPELPEPKKEISCLKNFKIKYTEGEKKLHKEYVDFIQKAESSLRCLELSIEERYRELYYVNNNHAILLETGRNGTECLQLPIKANIFIKAAESCVDGPQPIETPISDNVFSEDVPF
jgi:hypothetical protein